MMPHFNIDDIPDEELDEESLRAKKRVEEMLETWSAEWVKVICAFEGKAKIIADKKCV